MAAERAAKSGDIKKIDDEIKKETDSINTDKQFIAGLAKSVENLDRGQREMDLMPIAAKVKMAGYVRFVFGVDSGFSAYKVMKDHFVKPMTYPLPGFPAALTDKLVKEFGADEKGSPDFSAARTIAGKAIDAKAMPLYRKEMTDQANASIRKSTDNIKALAAKRKKLLGL